MANHCFLASPNLPPAVVLDAEIRQFVAKHLPVLNVVRFDKRWLVTHESGDEVSEAVSFWFHDENWLDGQKYVEAAETYWKVVEFRHGHGMPIYWWFEYEIRALIHEKYNCLCDDEGIGPYEETTTHYDTFMEYLREKYNDHRADLERLIMQEYFDSGIISGDKWKSLVGI